ncbi:TetR/AcrR family transcriptional regulator [Paenibacillus sp. YPG26]|uniref:TetR/AcrR family transcriptional regulator n=1 Tax=Paenibacillus sp. YPG26 TaxID=2878915 RepID=UPI00203FA0FD|nr:TetR/AcrR family transcriptional regulator [Paenibacillus sp. YPG26]USB31920.1 TetR/AcrR family transcriptional regulator [Paenibacillus sp. YPG26]
MPLHDESRSHSEINELILKNARLLIEQRGADKVSMHQIAKAAGIGQGTLYRRYTSVGDICLHLVDEKLEAAIQDIRSVISQESRSLSERIEDVVHKWVNFIEDMMIWIGALQDNCKMQKMGFEFSESPPYAFIYGTLVDLLKSAADSNELQPCDPCFNINAFLFLFTPDSYIHLRRNNNYSPEAIASKAYALYFKPLFVRP